MNDVIDPDFDWRCRFDWILFRCLFEDDSGKNAASGVLTKIWNQIVSNKEGGMKLTIEQEEEFLRICTHYGVNTQKDADARKDRGWDHAYNLQRIKSDFIGEQQVEKMLEDTLNAICPNVLSGKPVGNRQKWEHW